MPSDLGANIRKPAGSDARVGKLGIAPVATVCYIQGMSIELSLIWFFIFATLQGIVLLVDEFVFHYRRELPRWERWGHPVDTFFFLLPLVYLKFQGADGGYWALAILSCLIITKDEWVHARLANGGEQWLHALLFVLHPAVLVTAAWSHAEATVGYSLLIVGVAALMIYQIVFWNLIFKRHSY
jgi:hypothetical protein